MTRDKLEAPRGEFIFVIGHPGAVHRAGLGDVILIRQSGERPTMESAPNYLRDVDANGSLTVADKGIANANLTKTLPPP